MKKRRTPKRSLSSVWRRLGWSNDGIIFAFIFPLPVFIGNIFG
jgi:hypothetical protein